MIARTLLAAFFVHAVMVISGILCIPPSVWILMSVLWECLPVLIVTIHLEGNVSATGESDQRLLNYIIYFRNVIYILIYDIKIGWSRLASKLV